MAQTWLVNERMLARARKADALTRPFLPLIRAIFPPHAAVSRPPKRILVSELWHIGDVVIAMPFLAALRQLFPDAAITLLSKSHAGVTLANTGLVDEVVSFDFPWTFLDHDRKPALRELFQIPSVVRQLRRSRFDLAFDCSRDGRNHFLMFLTGAARRVGFAFGGGEFFLTDAVPVGSLDLHRTEDWLRLLEPVAADRDDRPARRGGRVEPREALLVVSPDERKRARELLGRAGHREGETLVAVHPGGSSHLKRWPVENFEALARIAAEEYGARILWIVDPSGTGSDAGLPPDSIVARPSLRELIGLLGESDLLVSNDGGPMHLAAALGKPTFAIYSWGKPEWWKPYGSAAHAWVQRQDITCRPCAGHCVFSEPICLTGLSLPAVAAAFRGMVATIPRAPSPKFSAAPG